MTTRTRTLELSDLALAERQAAIDAATVVGAWCAVTATDQDAGDDLAGHLRTLHHAPRRRVAFTT